jgi:hypothetical protein
MKYFLIRYSFKDGATDEWHREIERFIGELDNDPELKGKLTYRCMKDAKTNSYFHLASAVDDLTVKLMQSRDFFKHYSERMRAVSGGVEVSHLDLISETHSPSS